MSLRTLPEITAFEGIKAFAPAVDDSEFDASILASAQSGTAINIYGVIGRDPSGEDNSERRISAALRSIGDKDVTVNLNSPGGSYYSGISIYNLLRAHPAKVTINVLGMAGSAASVIAMAGDEIAMGEGATLMVHCASALFAGNRHNLGPMQEALTRVDDTMATLYANRASVDKDTAASWMDRNAGEGTHFSATRAIELKLADRMLPKSAIKAEYPNRNPAERRAERALKAAGMSAADAKALVAELKGARDAAPTARDAGFAPEAVSRLLATLQN
jgi:ATP-dependent protease ClpP protease subunit